MKKKREYIDYLRDILDAAEKAERFVEGMDFAAFAADEKTVFAITRALEIIGEASKQIPPAVRRQHHDVPWREIAGMRDKISHDYFGVNLRRVFDTVREDLPPLRTTIARILKEMEKGEQHG